MRTRSLSIVVACLLLCGAGMALAEVPPHINVQGRLTDAAGNPLPAGLKLFVFKIYDAQYGGTEVWPGLAGQEEQIIETDASGLWTAQIGTAYAIAPEIMLDPMRWLEVVVTHDATPYTLPRIRLLAAPYSLHSEIAQLSRHAAPFSVGTEAIIDGSIEFVDIGSNGAGEGQVMKWSGTDWVPANDQSGGEDDDWRIVGDVLWTDQEWGIARKGNVLLGNEDYTHINLGVACTTGSAISNYSYATVSGGLWNLAEEQESTVGGGCRNRAVGQGSTVSGGNTNLADGVGSAVSGGSLNEATQDWTTVGGGQGNHAELWFATVAGGVGNYATGASSTCSGGAQNRARGAYAVVGGGGGSDYVDSNAATGDWSTVPGGRSNIAAGQYALAAGRRAKALNQGSFVWGDATNADFASTGNNQFLIRASGGVGIGTNTIESGHQLHVKGLTWFEVGGGSIAVTTPIGWPGMIIFSPNGHRRDIIFDNSAMQLLTSNSSAAPGAGNGVAIAEDGDVGIGTQSPNFKLDVRGTIGNNTTTYHSDRRWKKNISSISGSLDIVRALRGIRYEWRENDYADMNFPGGQHIGLIAQEVEAVVPELVHTDAEGFKSVEYANLVAVLIEAIKEQQARIDTLAAEVLALQEGAGTLTIPGAAVENRRKERADSLPIGYIEGQER